MSRWLAGAVWAMLTRKTTINQGGGTGPIVTPGDAISCPTLDRVLLMAKAEWAGR